MRENEDGRKKGNRKVKKAFQPLGITDIWSKAARLILGRKFGLEYGITAGAIKSMIGRRTYSPVSNLDGRITSGIRRESVGGLYFTIREALIDRLSLPGLKPCSWFRTIPTFTLLITIMEWLQIILFMVLARLKPGKWFRPGMQKTAYSTSEQSPLALVL